MKAIALAAALATLSAAAMAQAPSTFVPFTVEQSDMQALQQYFDHNTPPAYSQPVLQWLNGLEAKAAAAAKPVVAPAPVAPPAAAAPPPATAPAK